MISDASATRPGLGPVPAMAQSDVSYVDWSAILAGGIFALSISLLLISFGAGLGLSLTSPYRGDGVSAPWLAIAAGIWFAWVMVTGFGAGGYLAGRMRRRAGDATAPEVEARDGMHGLIVWATGALAAAILATLGVGGVLSAGATGTAQVVDAAGEAMSSDYFDDLMLRDTVAASETDAATTAPGQPPTTEAPVLQREVVAILARSAVDGQMAERDSTYLAQTIAANSDLDQTAARTRVDEVNAEIADARTTAMAAVEKARVAGVVFGFIAAATLLIGAVAAFFAATAGGRHRDEGLGLDVLMQRR
ncbi:hypothetical protein [Szabonella alba]|uniref:Mll5186 protein n=1 Tax=Szabonella alba TaxID=2804194 RepID=A0A8K0Y247_9RHOB|nr:hypothetical protein [Szabonella alba]MBL4918993.1 hypothetical protein [Szabonella alba]